MKTTVSVMRLLLLVVLAMVLSMTDPTEASRHGGGRRRTLTGCLGQCLCNTDPCNACFTAVTAGTTTTYAGLGACLDAVTGITPLTKNTSCVVSPNHASRERHGSSRPGGRHGPKTLNIIYERCLCEDIQGTTTCNACFDRVDAGTITTYADLGACLDAVVPALSTATTCIGCHQG
ncbi:uncharacterized protein LOC127006997 [Eriocheir sinensis]|uniref:uncharacterized protein LOC127006997 n=1 Tax=Eriocheir sinensis TaxID=95602 RepID=UPI0021C6FB6E|nr:uncharacterized protein LOC127006997 [Eriocheir sinensis]XP_050733424.1 uncharacterized protein LOC127006997 [Eriocheir sinensis]XP_050733425.1 uncharacterized protein LOC127006997 [Eriocheir sinensis]